RYVTVGYQNSNEAWQTTVWDVGRQQETARLAGIVVAYAPESDKAWVWLSRASGEVRLHDLASGREEKQLAVGPGWHSFVPHPDGLRLAVTQPSSAVQVWNVQTGKVTDTLLPLRDLGAWSPDGKFLVGVSEDNRIRVLDVSKGELQSESARMPS